MSVLGHGVEICTTATRPASAPNGTLIFDTDVSQLLVRVGGSWVSSMANQSAGGVLSGTYPDPTLGSINTINSSGGDLALQTNGTTRLNIDINGRVTFPYQPRFMVFRTTNTTLNSSVVFNVVHHNNGGWYSAATGRFTVPTTGAYHFNLNSIGITSGTTRLSVRINGTSWAPTGSPWHLRGANTSNYADASMGWIMNLTAGVWIDIYSYDQIAYSDGSGYLNWSGFFLG